MFVIVDLVNHEHDRFSRFTQRAREIAIDGRETVFSIDYKQEKIAFAQGAFRGLTYLDREFFFTGAKNSAGVPECERLFSARTDCRDPVARNPGLIVNDGDFAANQAIEECRLPDIRTSDDCNARDIR